MSSVKPKTKKTTKKEKPIKKEPVGLKLAIYNQEGQETGKINLPEAVFGLKPSQSLIKQAIEAQLSNSRINYAKTKGRGEVRGGGKKPWRQKGTGRARHGSIRSPLWKGGGVTFGPTNEKIYAKKINKKMKRLATLMVLSGKARDNELLVIDDLKMEAPKTKFAAAILKNLSKVKNDLLKSALIILNKEQKEIERAARNIPRIGIIAVDSLNIVDLLSKKYLIITKAGIEEIGKIFSPKK